MTHIFLIAFLLALETLNRVVVSIIKYALAGADQLWSNRDVYSSYRVRVYIACCNTLFPAWQDILLLPEAAKITK